MRTPWNDELKADAGNPTLSHLRDLVARTGWQRKWAARHALADIPRVKVGHFALQGRALDAGRMQALEPHKRATLTVALLATQAARALDDLGEMFVRGMQHIHNAARQALERYRAVTVERTHGLVMTLHQLILAHQGGRLRRQRFGDRRADHASP